ADDGGAGGGGSAQAVNVPAQAELIGQRLAAELAQEDRVVDEVAAGIQIGLGVVQHLDVGDLPVNAESYHAVDGRSVAYALGLEVVGQEDVAHQFLFPRLRIGT